jgi:hypothetical protein
MTVESSAKKNPSIMIDLYMVQSSFFHTVPCIEGEVNGDVYPFPQGE